MIETVEQLLWQELDALLPDVEETIEELATMANKRIVVIDGHIIVQFNSVGWWTCSKANNYNEDDFAFWTETPANMQRAINLVGNVPVVRSDRKPIQRQAAWYINNDDTSAKSYNEALRALARSIK
jgi:hypothetical protein